MVAPRDNVRTAGKYQIRLVTVKTVAAASVFAVDDNQIRTLGIDYPPKVFFNEITAGSAENVPNREYLYQIKYSILTALPLTEKPIKSEATNTINSFLFLGTSQLARVHEVHKKR
jgi:hypothetical protein